MLEIFSTLFIGLSIKKCHTWSVIILYNYNSFFTFLSQTFQPGISVTAMLSPCDQKIESHITSSNRGLPWFCFFKVLLLLTLAHNSTNFHHIKHNTHNHFGYRHGSIFYPAKPSVFRMYSFYCIALLLLLSLRYSSSKLHNLLL